MTKNAGQHEREAAATANTSPKREEVHLRRLGRLARAGTRAATPGTRGTSPPSSFNPPRTIQPGPADEQRGPPADAVRAACGPAGSAGSPPARRSAAAARTRRRRRCRTAAKLNDRRVAAACPAKWVHCVERLGSLPRDESERQELQDEPDRLRRDLHPADEADAVDDDRDDHQRADRCSRAHSGMPKHISQRQRHDRGFDRKEEERERRVDQRGDRRADVAEARAAGEQVDVHAVAWRRSRLIGRPVRNISAPTTQDRPQPRW